MQRIKNVRLATQGMMAVLLFGMVFAAAGAEQTMRALPRTAPAPAANAVLAPAKPNAALVPEIIIDGGGIQIGGKLVPLNGATPVSISSTNCSLPFQFSLKNIGNKGLSSFTISMKMKSEQNQSLVYDGPLGGLSLAPGAIYKETHNGSGLNLVSGTTYRFTVDTDSEHNMRKDISRGHIYSVRFIPNCGSTPAPTPGGTPGTTPTPTQRPPKQSMGGGLRMGSALTPRSQPSAQPPQGFGSEKHSTLVPAQPSQGGGMAQLNSVAACASDNTPRISNINGTQSGVAFQPGSKLNISGCGFSKGGQAYLSGGGTTVPLKIDSWDASNIHAHIDAPITGVLDIDSAKVSISPSGAPVIESKNTIGKFMASRRTYLVTTNIPRYVKFEPGPYNKTTLRFGGLQQDGTVSRSNTGFVERADASQDNFTPLDPGKGFKVTKFQVKWLTQKRNGATDIKSGHALYFRGDNSFRFNDSGSFKGTYWVNAGDQFIQDENDPQLPPICIDGSVRIRYCVYSIYQVSVEVTGPAGVSPP
jgi:hypothetical protein